MYLVKIISWYYFTLNNFGDYTLSSEHWENFSFSLKYIFHALIEIYDENNYPHKQCYTKNWTTWTKQKSPCENVI